MKKSPSSMVRLRGPWCEPALSSSWVKTSSWRMSTHPVTTEKISTLPRVRKLLGSKRVFSLRNVTVHGKNHVDRHPRHSPQKKGLGGSVRGSWRSIDCISCKHVRNLNVGAHVSDRGASQYRELTCSLRNGPFD